MNTPAGAIAAAVRPLPEPLSKSNDTMATSPPTAAATMTISWATGRKSCRCTVRWVAAASSGQSTTHPATTKIVADPAIAASTPSSAPVRTPTVTPISPPSTPAPANRVTAATGITVRLTSSPRLRIRRGAIRLGPRPPTPHFLPVSGSAGAVGAPAMGTCNDAADDRRNRGTTAGPGGRATSAGSRPCPRLHRRVAAAVGGHGGGPVQYRVPAVLRLLPVALPGSRRRRPAVRRRPGLGCHRGRLLPEPGARADPRRSGRHRAPRHGPAHRG